MLPSTDHFPKCINLKSLPSLTLAGPLSQPWLFPIFYLASVEGGRCVCFITSYTYSHLMALGKDLSFGAKKFGYEFLTLEFF